MLNELQELLIQNRWCVLAALTTGMPVVVGIYLSSRRHRLLERQMLHRMDDAAAINLQMREALERFADEDNWNWHFVTIEEHGVQATMMVWIGDYDGEDPREIARMALEGSEGN